MIKKTIKKRPLDDKSATADDLAYWLSKTPEERVTAVEYLQTSSMETKADPDFSALLALLNAHRVEYMIVGGHALALHGSPRFTGDLEMLEGT